MATSVIILFRKFQHRNARRSSGGIVVYCKNELVAVVEIVNISMRPLYGKNWIDISFERKMIYICVGFIYGEKIFRLIMS